jgi:hypothetical protein
LDTSFVIASKAIGMNKKLSKSPQRHTFQAEGYIKRCEEKGEEPREDYINLYKSARQQDEENMVNPEWQKDNMEYDLRSTDWILEKVRASDSYAQNLYAAMCNNDFVKREMWPILKDQRWSCSWRHAGGIIADMQQKGDYIDWYCSGMGGFATYDLKEGEEYMSRKQYVPESQVTEEIEIDLNRLGWIVVKYDDAKDI